jgi:type III pantothenate kinase
MQYAVDIGNTRIKIGHFQGNLLEKVSVVETLNECYAIIPKEAPLMVCSVAHSPEELNGLFPNHQALFLTTATALPIQLDYRSPETLGHDRLALASGAFHLFPKKNVLVIDGGSCITYDLLDHQGIYQGGMISPGISMRLRSMHAFTSNLPDVRAVWLEKYGRF